MTSTAQNPNHTKNKNDKSNVSKVYQFFVFLLYLLPGRDTVARVHEGLPLGALGHVVDEDSRHVDRDEQDDVGHQLQSTQTTTINNQHKQLQSTQTELMCGVIRSTAINMFYTVK